MPRKAITKKDGVKTLQQNSNSLEQVYTSVSVITGMLTDTSAKALNTVAGRQAQNAKRRLHCELLLLFLYPRYQRSRGIWKQKN